MYKFFLRKKNNNNNIKKVESVENSDVTHFLSGLK